MRNHLEYTNTKAQINDPYYSHQYEEDQKSGQIKRYIIIYLKS